MPGPAWFLASTPVSTKMPVPITMPIPNPIRSRALRLFFSPAWSSSFWWRTVSTSLVRVTPVFFGFFASVEPLVRSVMPPPSSWLSSCPTGSTPKERD